ncbi:MAG: HIT family protein [Anaerolineales bacterium]|nr:HIT family protein [Anaerolineales bacterium]
MQITPQLMRIVMCSNNMNKNCMFCQIISGAEPAQIIFRDENTIAFFPTVMNAKGHIIIAPVQHYSDIYNIPTDELSTLANTVKLLAERAKHKLGADGVHLLHVSGEYAQQSIPHFHLHLLPRFDNDDMNAWPDLPKWEGNLSEVLAKMQFGDRST